MQKLKKIIKLVLKIYRTIMRIKEYINVSKFIEDWKEENPDSDLFGINKRPKKGIRKLLLDKEDELIRAENGKKIKDLEKRKHTRGLRNRRNNK